MIALFIALMLLTVLAVGVVGYAAYTHRGLPLPGSSALTSQAERWQDSIAAKVGGPLENTAVSGALISHGVMMTPEQDLEARHWFVRAERKVVSKLPARARRRLEAHLPKLKSVDSSEPGNPVIV